MVNVSIRLLEDDDTDQYHAMLVRALTLDEKNFRIAVQDLTDVSLPTLGNEDSFSLGAFTGQVLVGIVSFERDGTTRVKARHKGRLFRMYVDPSFRGQGVGRALISEVLQRAKSLPGLDFIQLTVMTHNSTAQALYCAFGFVRYGTEPAAVYWNNEYRDEDLMALDLRSV